MRQTRLVDLFFEHQGHVADKWEHYLCIYEHELAPLIDNDRAIALLEIGVQNGGSLELWKKYLPAGSRVTGIDIDERCRDIPFQSDIEVIICSAADPASLNRVLGGRIFDVIIDDGSHLSHDIVSSFKALFSRLRPGGKFIIEDLHACYFRSHGGAYRHPDSAIEWLKNFIDWLNLDHFDSSQCEDQLTDIPSVPKELARITFYDSVAVIEKLPATKAFPYRRILTGRETPVVNPASWLAHWPGLGSLVVSEECARMLDQRLVAELTVMRTKSKEAAIAAAQQLATRQSDMEGLVKRLQVAQGEVSALRSEAEAQSARYKAEIARLEGSLTERFTELTALNQVVRDQTAYIEAQRNAILAAQTRVAEVDAQAERQSAEIVRLQTTVGERFREVETLTRLLKDSRSQNEEREKSAGPILARATEAEGKGERQAAEIAQLKANVAERFREIAMLTELLKDKDGAGSAEVSAEPRAEAPTAPLGSSVWKKVTGLPITLKTRRRLRRQRKLVAGSGLFDPTWYLESNPDVKAARMDPLQHYLLFGGREGRAPSRAFDSKAYLSANGDVEAAGVNPLVHYLTHGRREGRSAFALR